MLALDVVMATTARMPCFELSFTPVGNYGGRKTSTQSYRMVKDPL